MFSLGSEFRRLKASGRCSREAGEVFLESRLETENTSLSSARSNAGQVLEAVEVSVLLSQWEPLLWGLAG